MTGRAHGRSVLLAAILSDEDDRRGLRRCAGSLRGWGYDVRIAAIRPELGLDHPSNGGALEAIAEEPRERLVVLGCTKPLTDSDRWLAALNHAHSRRPPGSRCLLVAWSDDRAVPSLLRSERVIGLHRPRGMIRLLAELGTRRPFDVEASDGASDWTDNAIVADIPVSAKDDALGFEELARTVAKLLREAPEPRPRTVSIEAPWGAGKTTFMRRLETALEGSHRIVRLEPWKFEKADSVWSHFAQELEAQSDAKWWHPSTWARRGKLAVRRIDLTRALPDIVRATLGVLAIALAIVIALGHGQSIGQVFTAARTGATAATNEAPAPNGDTAWSDVIKMLLALLVASPGVGAVASVVAKNLSFRSLVRHVRDPQYGEHLPFLHTFHDDLAKLLKVYVTAPTAVFIDDLDRCDAPVAAEIFQAINLMIPDHDDLVFVLAFDREKVAAAIASRHDKLLPLLAPAPDGGKGGFDRSRALEYGHLFMQKFIHVPIRLPRLPPEVLANLGEATPRASDAPDAPDARDAVLAPNAARARERRRRLIQAIAPVLDGNPRRLRHFLNTMVVNARTLEMHRGAGRSGRWPSMEHLAKFTAINLRCPEIIDDLAHMPNLLAVLEEVELDPRAYPNGPPGIEKRKLDEWSARQIPALLARALDEGDPRSSFVGVDIEPLVALMRESEPARTTSKKGQGSTTRS